MKAEPLLLFVTGIPSKTTSEQLLALLSEFGNFRILCLKNSRDHVTIHAASPKPNLKRGFCIVEASEIDSFNQAIDRECLLVGNRSVKISKFMFGRALQDSSREEELRRVIVKKIPQTFTQDQLTEILCKLFGTVTRIFRYVAPDKAKRVKKKAGRFHTYSVEFDSAESAAQASAMGHFCISGLNCPIIIEGFKRKSDIKVKELNIAISPMQKPYPRSTFERSTSIGNLHHRSAKAEVIQTNTVSNATNNPNFFSDAKNLLSIGKAFRFFHYDKPTTRAYHVHRTDLAYHDREVAALFLPTASTFRFNVKI